MAVAPAPARPRPGGGRLFIIVGLLMAVVAFGGVFLLASTLGGGGGGGPTTKAVVAKQDIPLRHVITDGDLDIANVSGNFGTLIYANKTDVINLISQIKISKGSVITSDMLARDINIVSGGAGAPAYLPLAKGFVAMTIPTGEIQGVAGHISIGDYITVIASGSVSIFNPSGVQQGPVKVVAKTVFYNLRVIGLGPATAGVQPAGSTGGGGGSATTTGVTSSLTVVLSQCDAEYLRWFLNNMTITYTLESYKDYLSTPPTDNSDPSCPNLKDPSGVSQTKVDQRFGFTRL